MTAVATAHPPGGYSLVLPPGWLRLPTRPGAAEPVLDEALDEAFAGLPRDSAAPLRAELRRRVLGLVSDARAANAVDVYVPLLGVRGRPLPASMLVALTTLPAGLATDAGTGGTADAGAAVAGLLSRVAADGRGTVVSLPAGLAARVETHEPPRDEGEGHGTRRVVFHLPVPFEPQRWVVVTCTVADGLPPMTETVVELFDALLTTWRWREGLVL
jgi:hypothetical protein